MEQQMNGFTKITVTVNGKRVGSGFLIDKETYLPVAAEYVPVHVQDSTVEHRESQMA
ncbi:hypothetical protein [Paenibacillus physcomitrellae]|uniref:Uncharacterized protein n=1 Tax=Paenibacillus physcomitrellae TaxID=1619311 RepID=A0ABQ1FR61_9BACL|nr:hypothetical protein [Paenibacillus physcomitrellae]GGA27435.1 hypothetical protein GCM10010917_10400 [Paenibacillus physcomitrellae]